MTKWVQAVDETVSIAAWCAVFVIADGLCLYGMWLGLRWLARTAVGLIGL